ncbi:PREDICTED: uncharacterized protein LOC104773599 [Camelina sativa]|uniref:Uncharacterized protein LOC104773599 n=1 Tax=Camelina sativa TaxID=90675 RepID=A0ABM0Y725_CAMSA|nr:PREDICTED: uncharacterized protein LOC104773599 [Camelina sativa]
MAYVEGGVVKAKRPIWRLRTIKDFFLSIINLIQVFFMTMFSMEKSDAYRKGSKANKKWGGEEIFIWFVEDVTLKQSLKRLRKFILGERDLMI